FTVTVPHKIADAAYYEKKRLSAISAEADFTGKRILLAEDNELNAEIATLILEDDPLLQKEENQTFATQVKRLFKTKINWRYIS
ncbi:MAG: hypothetical protein ACLUDU_15450, partial [Butyricimonas faecihominis]